MYLRPNGRPPAAPLAIVRSGRLNEPCRVVLAASNNAQAASRHRAPRTDSAEPPADQASDRIRRRVAKSVGLFRDSPANDFCRERTEMRTHGGDAFSKLFYR